MIYYVSFPKKLVIIPKALEVIFFNLNHQPINYMILKQIIQLFFI